MKVLAMTSDKLTLLKRFFYFMLFEVLIGSDWICLIPQNHPILSYGSYVMQSVRDFCIVFIVHRNMYLHLFTKRLFWLRVHNRNGLTTNGFVGDLMSSRERRTTNYCNVLMLLWCLNLNWRNLYTIILLLWSDRQSPSPFNIQANEMTEV